eukprot:3948828-Pyramimonas_sp.AAC.2
MCAPRETNVHVADYIPRYGAAAMAGKRGPGTGADSSPGAPVGSLFANSLTAAELDAVLEDKLLFMYHPAFFDDKTRKCPDLAPPTW